MATDSIPGSKQTRESVPFTVRTADGVTVELAYSSPRPESHATSSPTVRTPAGGSTSSSGLPTRSRTQAKYSSFIRRFRRLRESGDPVNADIRQQTPRCHGRFSGYWIARFCEQ